MIDDGSGDIDKGEEVSGCFFESGGYFPVVFESFEEALYSVSFETVK